MLWRAAFWKPAGWDQRTSRLASAGGWVTRAGGSVSVDWAVLRLAGASKALARPVCGLETAGKPAKLAASQLGGSFSTYNRDAQATSERA